MDTLILEDFRCFAGLHEVPLRPLTLLVGENSTGKTSFLAANQVVREAVRLAETPDFNREPFDLGAYNEIATFRAGRAGRAKSFVLGFRVKEELFSRQEFIFRARFVESEGLPSLSHWEASIAGWSVAIRINGKELTIERKTPTTAKKITSGMAGPWLRSFFIGPGLAFSDYDPADNQMLSAMINLIRTVHFPYASAPIRAEPQRNYPLSSIQHHPQGKHVPVIISQMVGKEGWETIAQPLQEFAQAAGLFDQITVRQLGDRNAGPFQILFKLDGPLRNMMDVGYGVSQILPLVFELIRGEKKQLFMVQQPEVHLHPRAQAELGTLFGSLVKLHKKQFLVETHSDNLIDRVRMDVRDKKNLRPDDVVILFFDRGKDGVKVHPIYLDDRGQLIDAPDTYRRFFLEEERRYWGLS